MNAIKRYFKSYLNIIRYYDWQTLVLYLSLHDFLESAIWYSTPADWVALDEPLTYYIFLAYFIIDGSIILSLGFNNLKVCSRLILSYLLLTLFATIRFIVFVILEGASTDFGKPTWQILLITLLVCCGWGWAYFRLKREMLYNKLNKEEE